jgi:hypothetical protein
MYCFVQSYIYSEYTSISVFATNSALTLLQFSFAVTFRSFRSLQRYVFMLNYRILWSSK